MLNNERFKCHISYLSARVVIYRHTQVIADIDIGKTKKSRIFLWYFVHPSQRFEIKNHSCVKNLEHFAKMVIDTILWLSHTLCLIKTREFTQLETNKQNNKEVFSRSYNS